MLINARKSSAISEVNSEITTAIKDINVYPNPNDGKF